VNSEHQIIRKKTRKILIGDVPVGGDSPISVQSMTNTLTSDSESTINQIKQLSEAGADIVRVSVPDQEAADSFKLIKARSPVPLVADIHFDYTMALEAIKGGAGLHKNKSGQYRKRRKNTRSHLCSQGHKYSN
jgi:(E)-4-hydroxy-3-methylbut-2-enyl-diphosphate synthase